MVDQSSPVTTSEQQAVPVAHFFPDAAAKLGKLLAGSNVVADDARTLVIAAREFWDPREDGSPESRALLAALEAFSSRVPYEDEPAALGEFASLPCKSGEGADHVPDVGKLVRELGPPCENCQKPVEVGQLVICYDDVGEMHADCDNPFSLDYDPPKDPAPEPVILLGSPMRHVPLALLSTPSEQFAKSSPDADAVAALEAWKDAQQATDDAVEHMERAIAEGWYNEPGGTGHVGDSDRRADAAWAKAIALRDAALIHAQGQAA